LGTVTASGWQWGADGNPTVHNPDETIARRCRPTARTSHSLGGLRRRVGGSPCSWTGGHPVAGGTGTATDSYRNVCTFNVVREATSSTDYANHGTYVKAMGGGDDATHSCIGMPIVAQR